MKHLEHAGQDRKVRKPRGERGEVAQRARQFLFVPERGQIVAVGTVWREHLRSPPVDIASNEGTAGAFISRRIPPALYFPRIGRSGHKPCWGGRRFLT